ncbi:trihelix transcription factor GT-2-like [Camellia sinensis]|uniref:trihelix transcription factor GT-2-like n=1 Tax=Camellia sinensis TaxID=4442 RepID=UPI0010359FC4|nr:trihelix transcription factor GT-2-like [Camellia sinensis]
MLGVSGILGNSGGDAPQPHESSAATTSGGEVGVAGSSTAGLSEEEKLRIEEGDRNSGGNRWPRQETLALLKIRSDMDVAFRDSSLKGPLWEQVSRKLADLGFHRSAKKCKEKFENVYKYHKRTKEGRSTKPDGKTYRFFDQLEALESQPPLSLLPPPPRSQTHQAAQSPNPVAVAMPMSMAMPASANLPIVSQVTVPSTANPTITLTPNLNHSSNVLSSPPPQPVPPPPQPVPPPPPPTTTTNLTNLSYSTPIPSSGPNMSMNIASISTSSSTSSDEEPERRCKRKRKWADFFQRLMSEVIEKQEEMQKKFLETLEKRERDRLAREEAWRVQEMARLNREHDLLIQERSMAASKDAAVIAYLQKISGQEVVPKVAAQLQTHLQTRPHDNPIMPPPAAPPQPQPQQQQQQQEVQQQQLSPIQSQLSLQTLFKTPENPKTDNGGGNFTPVASSSRWPKAEVQALIQLRTNMDLKYQENGPKGPLWEEMSAAMRKLGYNRNAKRCKEKWENINKYFKKVKESNKKRPEDSKTCPYFHQLDALYREKAIAVKPENPMMVPIMVQPEQQWPLLEDHRRDQSAMEDHNDDNGHNEDEDDDEEDEDDEAGGYEIVANKPPSVGTDE